MKRETTNRIRYILEEWVPPVIRDSGFMRWLFHRMWGSFIDDLERFRRDITQLSAEEYRSIYERITRLQHDTDNSEACLAAVEAHAIPGKMCDVGCGTGHLLNRLAKQPALIGSKFTGIDFMIEEAVKGRNPAIQFIAAPIEKLPFPNG